MNERDLPDGETVVLKESTPDGPGYDGAVGPDRATVAQGRATPLAEGELAAQLISHGSMVVEFYAPRGKDEQNPHDQDELYVIISGTGTFTNRGEHYTFGPGDILFVRAGVEHRFEEFTDDFAVWVIFYGPKGGEAASRGTGCAVGHGERDFDVVRASQKHLDQVAPLFDAYRRFYGRAPDTEGTRGFLVERMTKGESVLFLAVSEMEAVGFAQLYPSFSSISMKRLWILNDLFVTPEARRLGVATALLKRAQQLAVETGAEGLKLATTTDNTLAQRLYERAGYKRDDAFHNYYLNV